MHYVCEVVIPSHLEVESAVGLVMAPFYEGLDREDEKAIGTPFWDFWNIGGRFAGEKMQASLDTDKMQEFHAELKSRNVTVSGVQCGKQELQPASQIPMVDALWGETFPQFAGQACPLFQHSNDQYDNADWLPGDVMPLLEVPDSYEFHRVIFAGPGWDGENHTWDAECEPKFMLARELWNGCNHEHTAWDGHLASALDLYAKRLEMNREEYREIAQPDHSWLSVTVDYHS